MINEDPTKRIDLQTVLSIAYFKDSPQLRIYEALADDLESMTPKEGKIFLTSLEIVVKEGLTIEKAIQDNFIVPVICSTLTYRKPLSKEEDYISAYLTSIIIELDFPPLDIISMAFKKSHPKNRDMVKLIISKRIRLHKILSSE